MVYTEIERKRTYAWREDNPDKIRELNRKHFKSYYEKNKEKHKNRIKLYRERERLKRIANTITV
jgi:hypothetical protein